MRLDPRPGRSAGVLGAQAAIAVGHALVWWQPLTAALGVLGGWWLGRAVGGSPRGWWRWVLPAATGAAITLAMLLVRQVAGVEVLAAVAVLLLLTGVPFELGRSAAARAEHEDRGWRLYRSTRSEQAAVRARAEEAERSRIAAEMHDALGHEMALIALRCSALQVSAHGARTDEVTERAEEIRRAAAQATDRLHEIVTLLADRSRGADDLDAAVQRARDAGLVVTGSLAAVPYDVLSPEAAALVRRVVLESLTNAAKHAPRTPVAVAAEPDDAARTLVVRLANAVPATAPRAAGGGRGLAALRASAEQVGGTLRHGERDGRFEVAATVPYDAAAPDDAQPERPARRRSLLLPQLLLLGGAVVLSWFVAMTVGSVLAPATYAALRVGETREATESLLPPFTMADAPQTVPEPSADCRYYESEVSFFRRAATYQVCFADERVVSLRAIPAGRAR